MLRIVLIIFVFNVLVHSQEKVVDVSPRLTRRGRVEGVSPRLTRRGREEKYYRQGLKYFNECEYDMAIDEFIKLIDINPSYKDAKKYLRDSINMSLRHPEKKIIRKEKDHLTAGIILYRREEYALAINQFSKVISLNPANKKAKKYLAKATKKHEKEKSSKTVQQKEILRQKEVDIGRHIVQERLINEGKKLFESGNYIAANENFIRVMALNPYNKEAKKYLKMTTKTLSAVKGEGPLNKLLRDRILQNSNRTLARQKKETKKLQKKLLLKVEKTASRAMHAEEGKILTPSSIKKKVRNAKKALP